MYRLRPIKGGASNRRLARFASSGAVATAAKASSSGGLFGWLSGGKGSSCPPLDVPLKDVIIPPPLPDHVEQGKTQITTLKNGLKIASETSAGPSTSLGLFINSGSIYEKSHEFGTTHLLERMAFKSTYNRSHLRIVREMEAIGGNMTSAASREHMSYTYDAIKTYLPQMVELLIDTVRNPAFLDWEIKEQIKKVKEELSEASKNPTALILEGLHSAGYKGALANPLMAPESAMDSLDASIVEQFVAENYTAPRMVLAASGVDHEELVKYAEPLLSDLPSASPPKEPKSEYVGGDSRIYAASQPTTVALAFELPGGWHELKDAMTLTVLQMLMGGGGSFSAGGPGKGMYSRLYLRVLNEFPAIQSFTAFSTIYNNTGLFGIMATTDSDFVTEAVDIACREFIVIANPAQIDQVQLNRAKQATKAAILMNLESKVIAAEDMGKQILTYGERKPLDQYLKTIEEVTPQDIANIARKLITSPLTMASHGDIAQVPSYDFVKSRFGSK